MAQNDLILSVENLQTKFHVGKRTVNAVNGVNLSLKRGKTLCIVGESGCGKSVTAHSVMQLLPSNGYIADGKVTYFPSNDQQIVLSGQKYPRQRHCNEFPRSDVLAEPGICDR